MSLYLREARRLYSRLENQPGNVTSPRALLLVARQFWRRSLLETMQLRREGGGGKKTRWKNTAIKKEIFGSRLFLEGRLSTDYLLSPCGRNAVCRNNNVKISISKLILTISLLVEGFVAAEYWYRDANEWNNFENFVFLSKKKEKNCTSVTCVFLHFLNYIEQRNMLYVPFFLVFSEFHYQCHA